jgi:hypothetical protein
MAGPFALASAVQAKLLALLPKPLNTATDGQVLTADSSSNVGVSWKAPAAGGSGGSYADATATTKGAIRLANDLAGTADAPALKQLRATPIVVGDSGTIPRVTVDPQGRVADATGVAISVGSAQIADLTETVQDIVGAMLQAGLGVTVSYDDPTGKATISATGIGGTGAVEPYQVSMRKQAADGSYSDLDTLSPDTTVWFIGTTVPDSSNAALADGSLFSIIDGSS